MPELPEVETIVSELRPRLEGRKILGVNVLWEPSVIKTTVDEFKHRLTGQTIENVKRRGKYIMMALASGDTLLIHLRMTGRLLLRETSAVEDKFTRVVIQLDRGQELRFTDARKFGRMSVLNPTQVRELDSSLGPEPLSEEFTSTRLREIVAGRSQRIKPLLIDQRYIVGLGNIYVDEALFEAGIHPARPAGSLSDNEIQRLYVAIRKVLSAGIADRGTTFDSYLDAFGKPGGHQFNLSVYRQAGEPCPRCGTLIERTVVGGRGTYFCPKCQPLKPLSASETSPPSRRVRQQRD